jgi:hypothetical protein
MIGTVRKLGQQLAISALANTLCDLDRSCLESHFADAGYSDPSDAADQALLVALEEIDSWPTIPSGRRLARERLSGLFVADPKPCPFCGEAYEAAVAAWNGRNSVQVDAEQRSSLQELVAEVLDDDRAHNCDDAQFRLARVLNGILNG